MGPDVSGRSIPPVSVTHRIKRRHDYLAYNLQRRRSLGGRPVGDVVQHLKGFNVQR